MKNISMIGNKNFKKRHLGRAGIAALATGTFLLCGCGASIPEMTEEENAQVAEYASGLLLKYDKNSPKRLVQEEDPEPVAEETQEPEAPAEEPAKDTGVPEGTEVIDNTKQEETGNQMSVQDFLSIENFDISYTGFEVADKYPESGESELYMAMGASPEHKLLVLKFQAANVSSADAELDTMSRNIKYKISVNGEAEKYTLTTMLLDDLSAFKGVVAAGETINLVLISEIPQDKVDSVESISLKMKGSEGEAVQKLQ